ncbi:MAG: hypothetical protein WA628_21465 [Terriglobales bacterium]
MPAQSVAVPPAPRPPAGPGRSPDAAQSSKMRPTGLEANGGSLSNGVYTNSLYGFSLKTPPGWAVVPSKDPIPLKAESSDSGLLKAAQISHTLLVMTENAPLRKSFQRKSIQILATRLLGGTTPTSAQDYLAYSQRTAKEKGMAVEYVGSPEEVTINGQKLWKVASNETVSGAAQHVEQYVITRQAILLQFFIVSPDEAGLKELEPSIQSLEFRPLPQKPSPKRSSKKTKATAGDPPKSP